MVGTAFPSKGQLLPSLPTQTQYLEDLTSNPEERSLFSKILPMVYFLLFTSFPQGLPWSVQQLAQKALDLGHDSMTTLTLKLGNLSPIQFVLLGASCMILVMISAYYTEQKFVMLHKNPNELLIPKRR